MKKTSILMSLGLMAMATACGGSPSVKKYGEAISKPTGTVSQAKTSAVITEDSKNNSSSSSLAAGLGGGGLPLPQLNALRNNGEQGLLSAVSVLGAVGNTDGVNLLSEIHALATRQQGEQQEEAFENPAKDFCGANAKYKQQIEAQKQLNGRSASANGFSVSYTFELTCKNNDEIFEMRYAIKASGAAEGATFNIDLNTLAKFGKYKDGFGGMYAIEGNISGSGNGQSVKISLSGGFGFFLKSRESYVAAYVLVLNSDSYVFYSLNDTSNNARPTAGAVCIKGANGEFIIKCTQESEESTTCKVWDGEGKGIDGNTDPAPDKAECKANALLTTLGEFIAL